MSKSLIRTYFLATSVLRSIVGSREKARCFSDFAEEMRFSLGSIREFVLCQAAALYGRWRQKRHMPVSFSVFHSVDAALPVAGKAGAGVL